MLTINRLLARSSRTDASLTTPALPRCKRPAAMISVLKKRSEQTRPNSKSPPKTYTSAWLTSRKPKPITSLPSPTTSMPSLITTSAAPKSCAELARTWWLATASPPSTECPLLAPVPLDALLPFVVSALPAHGRMKSPHKSLSHCPLACETSPPALVLLLPLLLNQHDLQWDDPSQRDELHSDRAVLHPLSPSAACEQTAWHTETVQMISLMTARPPAEAAAQTILNEH